MHICWCIYRTLCYESYTGWAIKNGTAYFQQYRDAIIGIGVWDNFSWEKLYQDQQFWFSSLSSREHFVRQYRGLKFSLSALTRDEWIPFSAGHCCQLYSFHLCQCAWLRGNVKCKECALIKLIGLLLMPMASQKCHSFTSSLSWIGKNWGLDIASQNVP